MLALVNISVSERGWEKRDVVFLHLYTERVTERERDALQTRT